MHALALAALLASAPGGGASDELNVDRIAVTPGTTSVRVPVRVRDRAGTLLDEGAGGDNEIQGYAFRIDFADAQVDTITFVRAGVTANRTPLFSAVTPGADRIVVLMSFSNVTDPLAFTLDAPAPGDTIGELELSLAPGLPVGTSVNLTLATASATLSNFGGTLSETVANGELAPGHGVVVIGDPIFASGFEDPP
jgi:hypothetical protein